MKRLVLAIIAATALLTATVITPVEASHPPGMTYGYWHKARYHRQHIKVAQIPNLDNYSDGQIIGPWNYIAGWPILQINYGQWPEAENDIVFWWATTFPVGPVNPATGTSCDCLAAWVQHYYVPGWNNGALDKVVIWLNPRVPHWQISATMIQHELGHALGLGGDTECAHPYRGVMSYCDFWGNGPWSFWWGSDDFWMMYYAGLR